MGYASSFGHTDVVALLVNAGADVNLYTVVGCVDVCATLAGIVMNSSITTPQVKRKKNTGSNCIQSIGCRW